MSDDIILNTGDMLPDLGPISGPRIPDRGMICYVGPSQITVNGVALSRAEISRRTGLSISMVSRMFGRRKRTSRRPSIINLKRLAKAFGPTLTLDDMYNALSNMKWVEWNESKGSAMRDREHERAEERRRLQGKPQPAMPTERVFGRE